ncbi:S-adenosyl-L-methionine-dependent methyltransferase [Paraphysoderma sedebokerense]|nr:S-adenosyl-L-methionine-dependent methyltransferase [Paraphysoderma sedebokerense]
MSSQRGDHIQSRYLSDLSLSPADLYQDITSHTERDSLYGLDHCILNIQVNSPAQSTTAKKGDGGDDSNIRSNEAVNERKWRVGGGWMNIGYWKDTTDFVTANKAFLNLILSKARISKADLVLDCGYGLGDQDSYIYDKFGCRIIGITYEQLQATVAQKRVQQRRLPQKIQLYQGDATKLDSYPFITDAKINKIVSVDSAYHYQTRHNFFLKCYNLLPPSGTLTLSDILIPSTLLSRSLFYFTPAIPIENLTDTKKYQQEIENIGFTDVQVEKITDEVFGGLTTWLWNFDICNDVLQEIEDAEKLSQTDFQSPDKTQEGGDSEQPRRKNEMGRKKNFSTVWSWRRFKLRLKLVWKWRIAGVIWWLMWKVLKAEVVIVSAVKPS